MAFYRQVGEIPRKRHTRFHAPDGALYAEELMGEEGFSSDQALLYHRHLPTAITAAEVVEEHTHRLHANTPLLPRHFRTHSLDQKGDLVTGRQLLLGNDDVRMSYVVADASSPLYRNAIGDELVYVEAGSARLESVYGALDVRGGDYVVIPTSTTHRWVPDGEMRAMVFEARGHIRPPKRYLSKYGQFLEHAPYCERDLRAPGEPLTVEGSDVEVLVRQRTGLTRYTYLNHPFDVVGWDGCLYPYALSIHDFEPITGRIHQPPPVHQTFEGPNFVVCSFVPRLFDYHPEAIPVPYNHANVDSDEVLFYVGGDFMSRKGAGIGVGSISLHPSGFTHGPQPGSVEASFGKEGTDELAVMLDTFRPLHIADAAQSCEDPGYAWTWANALKTHSTEAGQGLNQ
ncbi:MAG: homogentisate 1,2-dioxygenase [Frankiaceae bacterium]|nr:homogentisate 1,2-dioxygenase [Frankiaceae bacterium]